MEKVIKLELKAIDFKDTHYSSWGQPACTKCAIEKAISRQFNIPLSECSEGVDECDIEGETYNHVDYTKPMFTQDKLEAEQAQFGDQWIIRTLTLTKQ